MMNTQWLLARRPVDGSPTDGDFRMVETHIPEPGPNQMLTRTIYLSLDPYQWGRWRSASDVVDEVCHGRTVSEVVSSNLAGYDAGDFVFNTNGWQEYGLTGAGVSVFNYMFPRKLDPSIAPISTAVGVLGMLGLTAYSGLVLQCQPQAGETVVVSAASGGVGQAVGQIAKLLGCRVVGIAGVEAKCIFVTETLGFDACVSHLSESLEADLRAACPDGADIYFESVGGKVFDAVLPILNREARISLCGLISQYGNDDLDATFETWMAQGEAAFARQNIQAQRLAVGSFVRDYENQFLTEMGAWVRAGQIKYKEDLWTGLGQAPSAFRAMMAGRNFGKTLVGVGDDPTLDTTITARRAGANILA